jgi:GTP pyrophosphokinase
MVLTEESRKKLADMITASYMALSTFLIDKSRWAGGNQFRHQLATRAILIDYGFIDSALHKAALVHDIIEDIPGFNKDLIRYADFEGEKVLQLVLEVTRLTGESKEDFLNRILSRGSLNARTLKVADRISNMHDLGLVSSPEFIKRYCDETEKFIFPMAEGVDKDMAREIHDQVASRRTILVTKQPFPEYTT